MKLDPLLKALLVVVGVAILLTLYQTWMQTETKVEYRDYEKLKKTTIELEPLPTVTRGVERPIVPVRDRRSATIAAFLEKHNPARAWMADSFVAACDSFKVDPYLVVAIGSLESGYFRFCVVGNCYGHTGSAGYISYPTLAEGIYKACQLMGNRLYAGKGIKEIGKVYAEDSGWAEKVESIYQNIKSYEN